MLEAMDRVGDSIRQSYHWIPSDHPCYLVMDNAGGHGSNEAKETYTNLLYSKYNIVIIFQIPRSPFTNVLDLGYWMSLQAAVERKHFMRRSTKKALMASIQETWDAAELDGVLTKVFIKLKVVLCNILRAKGGNDLVEEFRGKKYSAVKIEDILASNEYNENSNVVDDMNNDDDEDSIQFTVEQDNI